MKQMEQNKKLARLWAYLNNLQNALNIARETQGLLSKDDENSQKIGAKLDEIQNALNNAETCLKEF